MQGSSRRPTVPSPGPRTRDEYEVLAVIVAYNSSAALERCLRSLDTQTYPVSGVIVIDNSEPRPLDLSELEISIMERTQIVPMGENLGPAGGFAFGLAWFQEAAIFTHAWLMDDDCYPEADALGILLNTAAKTRRGSAVFPSAVYEATGVAMNYPGWSGVLLDRLAVRLAGLPIAELFWWAEDTEYLQHRLPRKGVVVVREDRARVLYDLIRRVGGRPPWKYYYEVRNTVWMHLATYRGSRIHRLPRPLIRMFGAALLSEGRRKKLHMYGRGVIDGTFNRLGRQVIPGTAVSDARESRGGC